MAYLVILAVFGLVIHHRVSGQVITEGAVLVALVAGAFIYEWYGRSRRRGWPTQDRRLAGESETRVPPEEVREVQSDEMA
ncbi:MAG: hypothetical protein ACRDPA_21545 [Solirubrobacteraceae bacterium]